MVDQCLIDVREYQRDTSRSIRFKVGLESSVYKYYKLGVSKEILAVAMGISLEDVLKIVDKMKQE